MKKLIAIVGIVISMVTTAQIKAQPADPEKGFDIELFQKALFDEMYIQFTELDLDLDTTLNYILIARSQESVGYPSAYVMKRGGNADILANEKEEAERLVKAYKERLAKCHFTMKALVNNNFSEFAALAMKVNGSVQYAIVLDNNFNPDNFWTNTEKLNGN